MALWIVQVRDPYLQIGRLLLQAASIPISYTDALTNTAVSFPDGAFTVQVRKNLNWAVSTGNGFNGGNYNLSISGTELRYNRQCIGSPAYPDQQRRRYRGHQTGVFTVQRSADGTSWSDLTSVAGLDQGTTEKLYDYRCLPAARHFVLPVNDRPAKRFGQLFPGGHCKLRRKCRSHQHIPQPGNKPAHDLIFDAGKRSS